MTKKLIEDKSYTRSSGNIFEDMGLANPEELLVKARLTRLITNAIDEKGWTQKKAAKQLGTTQPKISNLNRGKIDQFSVEKLISFLTDLEHDVTITVKKGRRKENKIVIPKKQAKKTSGEARV